MFKLVLAGDNREYQQWCAATGDNHRTARFARSAFTAGGGGYDTVVELPGYKDRPDRHAINAAVQKMSRRGFGANLKYEIVANILPFPDAAVEREGELPGQIAFDDIPADEPVSGYSSAMFKKPLPKKSKAKPKTKLPADTFKEVPR